jgi:hypothetical protein
VNKACAAGSLAGIPERRAAAEERGVTFESFSHREVLLSQLYLGPAATSVLSARDWATGMADHYNPCQTGSSRTAT